MIRTFGLHWHVDRVFWGWPGVRGTLIGCRHVSEPVDFRYQRGIYALYADYALVYIGQTGARKQRLFNRLNAHRRDHLSERWNRFSWFGTRWVLKKNELAADADGVHIDIGCALDLMEAISTAIAEPRLNLSRGRWGEAIQYYQWWEEEEEGEVYEEENED